MEEEKTDIELFDRFLKDEMTHDEREAFQNNLQADPDLQSRFREYTDIVGGIRIHAFRALKEKLKANEKSAANRKRKTRPVFVYITGIAAAIVLLTVFGYILMTKNKGSHDDLFREYYSPYPNIVEPVSRSGQEKRNYVWVEYEQGEYSKALEGFQKMAEKDPANVPAYFYSGICLLSLNKPEKAIKEFDRISPLTSNSFTTPGKWYKALALIKNNQPEKARQLLREIESGHNEYSGRATTLLGKL